MIVLHAGCGPKGTPLPDRFSGWKEIRLDANPAVDPDLVCSVIDILAASQSVDAIFCSHMLEHLPQHEVKKALSEFARVLKPDGFILVTVPDLQQVGKLISAGKLEEVAYDSPAGPISALDMTFGHQASIAAGNHYMAHKTGFTAKTLKGHIQQAGFTNVLVSVAGLNLWAEARLDGVLPVPQPAKVADDSMKWPRQMAIAHCTLGRPGAPVSLWWHRAVSGIAWPFNTTKAPIIIEDDEGGKIAEGRNMLVAKVLERETPGMGIRSILWIDDDVVPISPYLLRALDGHDEDICAGVYFSKEEFPQPLIFPERGQGVKKFVPEEYYDVWGVGMGLTLVKTDVYRRMKEELKLPLDSKGNPEWYRTTGRDEDLMASVDLANKVRGMGGTEDLYFCNLAARLDIRPWVDTGKHCFGFHYDMARRVGYPKPQWETYRKECRVVWETPDGPVEWS